MERDARQVGGYFRDQELTPMIDDIEVRIEYLALQVQLIQLVKPPNDRPRQTAALEMAYDNLACSNAHRPSRALFSGIAMGRYLWTQDEFDLWADEPGRDAWLP